MVIPSLDVLSVYFWLTYLVVVSAALRFQRTLRFSERKIAVVTQRHRQRSAGAAR